MLKIKSTWGTLGAGDSATKTMAPESSFTTSPPVGAASQLRFLAWADSGQATYDGTNEYDYSEVGTELRVTCCAANLLHLKLLAGFLMTVLIVGSWSHHSAACRRCLL